LNKQVFNVAGGILLALAVLGAGYGGWQLLTLGANALGAQHRAENHAIGTSAWTGCTFTKEQIRGWVARYNEAHEGGWEASGDMVALLIERSHKKGGDCTPLSF